VGLWPQTRKLHLQGAFEDGLRAFGYGLRPEVDIVAEVVISAFQRHFRPAMIDGVADEECARILAVLLDAMD
jgi:N-acetylmuramoyl-L-alanine amidase